jgi:hypothetical protein
MLHANSVDEPELTPINHPLPSLADWSKRTRLTARPGQPFAGVSEARAGDVTGPRDGPARPTGPAHDTTLPAPTTGCSGWSADSTPGAQSTPGSPGQR